MLQVAREGRRRKFVGRLDDEEVCYLQYRKVGTDCVDFFHTETKLSYQNRGYAKRVVLSALDWAKTEQLTVIPSCTYVKKIIDS